MNLDEAALRALGQNTADLDQEVWEALRKGSDESGRAYYLLLKAMGSQRTLEQVPGMIARVLETGAWQRWRWIGQEFQAQSFAEYVTRGPPSGLGATLEIVERLLQDDPAALTRFRRAVTGRPGGDRKSEAAIKTDNVSIESGHGNSRAYTLARLERSHSELFARVVAGELTANAAAIAAGIRPSPPTPLEKLRKAWNEADPEERNTFWSEVAVSMRLKPQKSRTKR